VGDHIFVTGVIVGMNQDGDEVKGIGVVGSQLMTNGTLVPVSGSVWGYRANFDGWENWASCAAGKIATAVDFHFAAGNAPRRLTGISLQCRTVTPL
jgi:hypothetical protein